ncbi:MAG: sigma-70 family RNA polymerase sigma factor [Deltaproteobacteria bacterium]|nr:sigma-70 family RNA polymerase sigma factor [Deltaproteobacteria bacterium]
MFVNLDPEAELRLVERLKRRDEAAFNVFVRTYEQKVFALVLRMLGNRADAQDLAQEVFVTVFRSIDSFRGDSRLGTWLYRVAVNHCKNRMKYLDRRATRAHDAIEDAHEASVADGGATGGRPDRPDESAEGSELEGVIQRALASLDEEHRTLLILRELESLPYEDIMLITGLPEGTVKSRLHRARAALREAIERRAGYKIPE